MSSSTSRKHSTVSRAQDVLTHPDVVALVDQGRRAGHVTSDDLRTATESAATTPRDLKAVLQMLSEEGVAVVVSAEDARSRKAVAAAASSARTTVKATAKKAPAKKAPAKKAAAAKAAPAKKTVAKKAAKTAPAKKAAKNTAR